jgi:hypothetical protein
MFVISKKKTMLKINLLKKYRIVFLYVKKLGAQTYMWKAFLLNEECASL